MSCLHRGPHIQRGRGIGSTLSAMFKGVLPAMQVMGKKILASPITQEVLQTAKRSAAEAGLNVVTDALQGKKVKESISKNVSTAKKAVTDSLVSGLKTLKGGNVKSAVKKSVGKKVAARKRRVKKSFHLFN